MLGNDNDPEGAVLTAVLVSGTVPRQPDAPCRRVLSLYARGRYTGSDSFTYAANDGTANSAPATAAITIAGRCAPTSTACFADRLSHVAARCRHGPSRVLGTWTITNGVLQGLSEPFTYAIARYDAPQWTDYTVEARIQLPAGAFGGGIGGRVNAATGARYTAAIYPDGSAGGSNVLKLVKFRDWTTWNYTPMQQVSLPDVGTGWHTLALSFAGNRIKVSYDGAGVIEVTDNNYDSRAPYPGGGISADPLDPHQRLPDGTRQRNGPRSLTLRGCGMKGHMHKIVIFGNGVFAENMYYHLTHDSKYDVAASPSTVRTSGASVCSACPWSPSRRWNRSFLPPSTA